MTLPETSLRVPGIPAQESGPRLPLFSLTEAQDLLRLLQLVADEGDELAEEARWFAQQLQGRMPPEN